MPPKKNKRGPRSLKSQKKKNRAKGRKRFPDIAPPSQSNDPFEQDAKRRIGQHGGAGEPPLMKK